MVRNRTTHGSLAASTAVVCVLSLAPPATGASAGFCGSLLDQSRCRPPVGAGERIVPGVACPPAGAAAGRRTVALSGGPVPGPCLTAKAGGIVVALAGAPGVPGETALRPRLAQNDAEQPEPDPAEDEPATEAPAEAGTPPDDAAGAFEGSPRPAGPDLTLTEERALISSGWE